MKHVNGSRLRKVLLPIAGTAVAVGSFLGIPVLKALAQSQNLKIMPLPNVAPPPLARLNIIQPRYVNPTTKRLLSIADQALSNDALAERIFNEPDAVAVEYNLSETEKAVLHHMDRQQFEVARADSSRLTAERLAAAGTQRLPAGATDTRKIAEGMIVGRAILAAVGRSYLDAANAHACCPWGKAIELGVNPSRVFYDEVFATPASLELRQPGLEAPRPNIQVLRPTERG